MSRFGGLVVWLLLVVSSPPQVNINPGEEQSRDHGIIKTPNFITCFVFINAEY